MINVMVRERKKVKGLSGSRKAATFYNGKSAAKSLLGEKRSTNRGGTSLISLPRKFLYSIMGMVETESDLTMEKTGLVYQIKNLENSKVYIGCTAVNFGVRISQHLRSVGVVESPLYDEMESDIKSFSFQIVENEIPLSSLRERESYWSRHFGSAMTGYNQVIASGNEKLIESIIWEVRDLLMTTRLKFTEIADLYNVSPSTIADINLGRSWLDESLEYPLRKQTVKRKQLSTDDIHEIYKMLRNSSLSFSEIALELGWSSEAVLRKINNGTYSVSPLPKECYPIRAVDSRKGRKSAQR
jgi:group I intron endonuclease